MHAFDLQIELGKKKREEDTMYNEKKIKVIIPPSFILIL